MKLLYLGNAIKNEECDKFAGPSIAGNKMQLGLIKALHKKLGKDLTVLTEYPIAAYPTEKKVFINNKSIEIAPNLRSKKVPFINIFLIKQITKILFATFMILNWCLKNRKEEKIIVCFNSYPDIATPILWISKIINIQTVCILADLPVNKVVKHKGLKFIARNYEERIAKKNIRKFDLLAVLNKNAIIEFAPNSDYVVLDGGFDISSVPTNRCGGQWLEKEDEKTKILRVLYSGSLTEYNGIRNLIEAAKLVENKKFSLEIYGSGELSKFVEAESKKNENINFYGKVSSEEIVKLQQNASLLVSPLLPEDSVAKVAFPSKIVEYLLSGTPVVSTKVSGLNEDYLQNLYTFNDTNPQTFANTIDEILIEEKEVLISKAVKAREFIIKEKNWDKQVKKVFLKLNH
ncbi:glycosyltransferase [Planococcus sp. 107-1]|uniref:glycosyltransferase n=1 Tax=Planococcus sp. 107-1 TaxID=2908840 RepID=UPI001F3E0944|nr:glycosyltransferase [Planococcus sp. 107-1]UJF26168.1 glycosyltransferase [Planococcus sp. 107-1]